MFIPTLGRWLQNDPIEYEADDPNLYRFTENNSASQIDPSGLVGLPTSVFSVLAPITGPLFRYERGTGDPPSLSNSQFKPAPHNYLGVLYGVESNGFRSAGVGKFRLKSTGAEAEKATFSNQSNIAVGAVIGCGATLTFDTDVRIKFTRIFAEQPAGSGKFPHGAGGGFLLLTLIQKHHKNVKLNFSGASAPMSDFWERVGVITPREAVYISGGADSVSGPRFGAKPIDATRALNKFTIDDKTTNMETELRKLYQFLIALN